jgi:molybdate/tungstate transport system substrate-binding protein
MQQVVGPSFTKATGYIVDGFSGGSDALASEIRGKTEVGDVFISASPKVNDTLIGPANGAWVSWYAGFATSPLILAYNYSSKFATALRSKP